MQKEIIRTLKFFSPIKRSELKRKLNLSMEDFSLIEFNHAINGLLNDKKIFEAQDVLGIEEETYRLPYCEDF